MNHWISSLLTFSRSFKEMAMVNTKTSWVTKWGRFFKRNARVGSLLVPPVTTFTYLLEAKGATGESKCFQNSQSVFLVFKIEIHLSQFFFKHLSKAPLTVGKRKQERSGDAVLNMLQIRYFFEGSKFYLKICRLWILFNKNILILNSTIYYLSLITTAKLERCHF